MWAGFLYQGNIALSPSAAIKVNKEGLIDPDVYNEDPKGILVCVCVYLNPTELKQNHGHLLDGVLVNGARFACNLWHEIFDWSPKELTALYVYIPLFMKKMTSL